MDSGPKHHFRKKKGQLSAGSEVLRMMFENGKTPLSAQFIRWKLWKKWEEYAGPTIAAVSEPVGHYRGVLHVWVKSSTWMQQLVFMREPLRDSINTKLGMDYVKEIKLTQDRKQVPQDAQTSEELKKSIQALMSESKDELGDLHDFIADILDKS